MKKLGNKLILAPVGLVVLAVVALVVLPMVGINLPVRLQLLTGSNASATSLDKGTATPEAAAKKPAVDQKFGMVYSTGERVLNLVDPSSFRYLKIEVVLELASSVDPEKVTGDAYKKATEELAAKLAPQRPALEDALTAVLTGKTVADISTPQGKEALKNELKTRLSVVIPGEEIRNVYFTEFIFQ